jgi:hypothetical protein
MGQALDDMESVGASVQGDVRLMVSNFGLEPAPVTLRHVGRIARDQVEWPLQPVEQVGAVEIDAIEHAVARRVPTGDLERGARNVGRDDLRRRPFGRQRHRHAAASGAEIGGDDRAVAGGKQLQRHLDDQLGFVTRNQYRRRDFERQSPEFLAPEDIGERLAAKTPFDERLVVRRKVGRFRLMAARDEAFGGPSEHELCEQPRVELGSLRGQPGIAKSRPRVRHVLMNAFHRVRKPPSRL